MCQLQPKAVTLIDFDHWLDSRVMAGTWAAPALPSTSNTSRQRQRATKEKEEKSPVVARTPRIFNTTQSGTYALCSGSHTLPNCGKFSRFSPKERAKLIVEKKRCFRCLLPGHTSKGCPRKRLALTRTAIRIITR